jgi:hypothetical protein
MTMKVNKKTKRVKMTMSWKDMTVEFPATEHYIGLFSGLFQKEVRHERKKASKVMADRRKADAARKVAKASEEEVRD